MTRKRSKAGYSSPRNPVWEKRGLYMNSALKETDLKEYSEVSPSTARDAGTTYDQFCGASSLIPTPLGWGLLHCTVRDKRGRRARVTLATDDLTYHRTFVEAATSPNRGVGLELAVARYSYMRAGWPGPLRQGGSWPGGGPIPWNATYRDACPELIAAHHLYGLQVAPSGVVRAIRVELAKGSNGAKWIMLDDEPIQAPSMIQIPDSSTSFYVPSGIAVMPGWPFRADPTPCSLPACA